MTQIQKKRCYHNNNSWLIAGGYWEWCYVCGAIRRMRRLDEHAVAPATRWQKPTGDRNKNPEMKDL